MRGKREISRRAFMSAAAAALAGSRLAQAGEQAKQDAAQGPDLTATRGGKYPLVVPGYFGSRPGVQLGTQLPATASDCLGHDVRGTEKNK